MKLLLFLRQTAFFFLLAISFLGKAQNAITLDPKTTGTTTQARTLSEGVGTGGVNLILAKTGNTSYLDWSSRIGVKSVTTTNLSTSEAQTAIFGRASHSTNYNRGLWGEAEAQGSAYAAGGGFSAYGSSDYNIYGIKANAHNYSNTGSVSAGYFNVLNLSNEGRGYKYGVQIYNTANYNDTTTANERYGLYTRVSGRAKYSSYGIYSNNNYADSVTHKDYEYGIYGSTSSKNNYSNYGLYGVSINYGTGTTTGGQFYAANYGTGTATAGQFIIGSGSPISNASRTAILAQNIASNADTVTVQNRYGIDVAINGRAKYDNTAIRAQNYNYYGDTLTAFQRTGIMGIATGKSKYSNVGVSGSAASQGNGIAQGGNFAVTGGNTNAQRIGVGGYAYNFTDSNSSTLTGAELGTYSTGNNLSRAIYASSIGLNTSTGTIYGINSYAVSDNVGNTNPTYGIYTQATGASQGIKYGIYATSSGSGGQFAGYFQGDVYVSGTLSKANGTFKIDHPQDPENKYLIHSFVESPEMKNIYDGVITTDANGDATVAMPSYFQALNVSFRYQLTCIGQFAQAIVSEEIASNSFRIKTDRPNVKVSWQVTGVRNDEWAKANPIIVEQAKESYAKGKYLNPKVFKQDASKGIHAISTASIDTKDYQAIQAQVAAAEQKQQDAQVKANLAQKQQQDAEDAQRTAEQKRMEDERNREANGVKKQ